MLIRFIISMIFLYPLTLVQSQQLTQTLRGTVVDQDSKNPLKGATIMIADTKLAATTDSFGRFAIFNVPVGRQRVMSSYVGYRSITTDQILINAAKEPEIMIEMEEETIQQSAVIVKASRNPKLPVNRSVLVSGRSFSPEETQRFAASANDPGRMATAFPGVQATRDTRSDIVIRANNPLGMQWKLEGVDIINPNHFARKGSTGGGITILSLSMLDQSDFLTGGMPAEYGDVLSGVFDMHLRKGNNEKRESSIKAGMIGLDYSTEGPIQNGRSSYLVNYRYSTLGLLDALGVNLVGERETNNFQDLSFNLSFKNKNNTSQWNVWAISGLSKETYEAVENSNEWKQYDDYATYMFKTKMGALGLVNSVQLSERSYLKTSIAAIGQVIDWVDDTLNNNRIASRVNHEMYNNSRLSLTSALHHKFNTSVSMKTGAYVTNMFYRFRRDKLDFTSGVFGNVTDGRGNTFLYQPYLQFSIKPGNRITINPGVHMMHLALNNKTAVDPRIAFQYRANGSHLLSFSYGLYSKTLPLGTYFYRDYNNKLPNLELDMLRSHHYILGWDHVMGKGWRSRIETYYQKIFNVPVVNDVNRTYWLLNDTEGYAREALVSKGKGENIGVDIGIEKFFSKGFFMIGSFSVFNSTFTALNEKKYNTRFNANTSGSLTGAKEWIIKNNKVFQLGWKTIYNGGFRATPLSFVQNGSREPVMDESRPYSEKIEPYFRTDARLALRKNKTGRSWQLGLDVQNIFGIKNTDALLRRYDPSVNQWLYDQQSGLVPVLSYQLDF
jgi:hypothetical protein